MPQAVRDFVFLYFTTASAPLFDAFLLLVILVVSYIGMLRRSVRRMADSPEPVPVTFYPDQFIDTFLAILDLVLQVILAFSPAEAEDEE